MARKIIVGDQTFGGKPPAPAETQTNNGGHHRCPYCTDSFRTMMEYHDHRWQYHRVGVAGFQGTQSLQGSQGVQSFPGPNLPYAPVVVDVAAPLAEWSSDSTSGTTFLDRADASFPTTIQRTVRRGMYTISAALLTLSFGRDLASFTLDVRSPRGDVVAVLVILPAGQYSLNPLLLERGSLITLRHNSGPDVLEVSWTIASTSISEPAVFCEHANESPATCPCHEDCSCRIGGLCRTAQSNLPPSPMIPAVLEECDCLSVPNKGGVTRTDTRNCREHAECRCVAANVPWTEWDRSDCPRHNPNWVKKRPWWDPMLRLIIEWRT